jgi:hypothetical protein
MARAPVLLDGWAADPSPDADDSGENQDHADENDEMCRVLGQREAGDASLVDVGDEIVLDEVEQQTERHDRQPESGKTRKRRSDRERLGSERRYRQWIDQSAYLLFTSLLLTSAIVSVTTDARQVFDQQRHAIE